MPIMFKPISCWIGLRYTRAKTSNRFISFISLTSMLGIALGVTVLITVLSVMNGFDDEIQQRFFGMAPHITITRFEGPIAPWQEITSQLKQDKSVLGVAPFVGGQALLTANGNNLPVFVSGIVPSQEATVSAVHDKMSMGSWSDLKPGQFGMVIGKTLADQLSVTVGDTINTMIPKATFSPVGMSPRFKVFKVVGIFSAGVGFGFDDRLAFIDLSDAQKLFVTGKAVTGLHLKINNIYQAPQVSARLAAGFTPDYQISNWTDQFGAFFKAVKMEKNMMFLILLLIIAVAAFNLVSSLVMIVNDKQSEIAILRTLGALPRTILMTFMVQGCLVGIIGTGLGLIGGLLLAANITSITNHLQSLLGVELLSSNVYFVDYLPSKIQAIDVIEVCLLALVMSFVATIYPAWRAAKTLPAEALRYD